MTTPPDPNLPPDPPRQPPLPPGEDGFTLPPRAPEELKPYELEIEPPAPVAPRPSPPGIKVPSGSAPREEPPTTLPPKRSSTPVRMGQGGLIDDFDEDADFDRDPEVATARKPPRAKPSARARRASGGADPAGDGPSDPEPADEAPLAPLVDAGRGTPRAMGIAGALAALVAMGNAARVRWPFGFTASFANAVATAYEMLMQVILGVAALAIAAFVLHRRFGRLDLACVRMLAAVAIFQFVFQVNLTGTNNFAELPLAAVAYALTIKTLFRFDWRTTGIVTLLHIATIIIASVGPALSSWAASFVAKAP